MIKLARMVKVGKLPFIYRLRLSAMGPHQNSMDFRVPTIFFEENCSESKKKKKKLHRLVATIFIDQILEHEKFLCGLGDVMVLDFLPHYHLFFKGRGGLSGTAKYHKDLCLYGNHNWCKYYLAPPFPFQSLPTPFFKKKNQEWKVLPALSPFPLGLRPFTHSSTQLLQISRALPL